MDSADEILLYSLRSSIIHETKYGNFLKEVTTIQQLTATDLICCIGRSLQVITGDKTIPSSKGEVPQNDVFARHRISTTLTSILKDAGYPYECKYSLILYPAVKEVRSILSWIVEKLQEDTQSHLSQRYKPGVDLNKLGLDKEVIASLEHWKTETWIPFARRIDHLPFRTCTLVLSRDLSPETGQVKIAEEEPIFLEAQDQIIPTALERACLIQVLGDRTISGEGSLMTNLKLQSIFKNSIKEASEKSASLKLTKERFKRVVEDKIELALARSTANNVQRQWLPDLSDDNSYDVVKEHKQTGKLQRLSEELEACQAEIASTSERRENLISLNKNIASEEMALEDELIRLQQAYIVENEVMKMLQNAEENTAKLNSTITDLKEHLFLLEVEWKEHSLPLKSKLEEVETRLHKARCKESLAIKEIEDMKNCLTIMAEEIEAKEREQVALEEEFKRIPQSLDRTLYTHRIVDIIKQVQKQDFEIQRVIADIRSLQRDINSLSQKLERTEAVADDTIFRLSEKRKADSFYVNSYRLLTELRQLFDNSIDVIRETGKLKNQARDLENRAETLAARVDNNRLHSVLDDLQAIREENRKLSSN